MTAKGAEFLAAKSGFVDVKYHITMYAQPRMHVGDYHRKWHHLISKILGLRQSKIGVRIVVTAGR